MQNNKDVSNGRLLERIKSWGSLLFAKDTPLRVKAIIALALLYLLSPYDFVPDWIAGLGLVDDLTLITLLVGWALRIAEKHKQ